MESPPFRVSDYVVWGSLGIAAAAGQMVLILFLVYFLLASGDLYRRKLVKIAGPSLTKKKVTLEILQEIDRQIERFLIVQLFTSTLVAIVTWIAFRALGVEQAAILGPARRRLQLDSLLRSGDRQRRHRADRVPAVRRRSTWRCSSPASRS